LARKGEEVVGKEMLFGAELKRNMGGKDAAGADVRNGGGKSRGFEGFVWTCGE
jgi:hypothetical protein